MGVTLRPGFPQPAGDRDAARTDEHAGRRAEIKVPSSRQDLAKGHVSQRIFSSQTAAPQPNRVLSAEMLY
jgi:hypothetical protein